MGQLSCTKKEDPSVKRLALTLSRRASIAHSRHFKGGSFAQYWGLGQYMRIGKNPKLDEIWQELLAKTEHTPMSTTYDNGLHNNELAQAKHECPLIRQELDLQMLVLCTVNQTDFLRTGLMGIPTQYRWSFWKVATMFNQMQHLSMNEAEYKEQCKDSVNANCISKDVSRTTIYVAFEEESTQEKLQHVLNAISNTNPKVGYCQGMNYIAALLLMASGGNEFEAYSVFDAMLKSPKFMLNHMFSEELELLRVLEHLTNCMMKHKLPTLHKHLQDTETPDSFWLSKILLSAFVYVFHYRDCVLFWDYIIIKGTVKGYLELIIGMMDYYEEQLLNSDCEGIATFFSEIKTMQADAIIETALKNHQISDKEVRKAMESYKRVNPLSKMLLRYSNDLNDLNG